MIGIERTLSIIKPDATRRNLTGKINAMIEETGLRIVAQKRIHMSAKTACLFYYVHQERSFFSDLIKFMASGPVVVQVLEGENAIDRYRKLIGATNPINATPGTIRAVFAENVEANSVHGSDSLESAVREVVFFFSEIEIVG